MSQFKKNIIFSDKLLILCIMLGCVFRPAFALYLAEDVLAFSREQEFVNRRVLNDTKSTKFYSIRVVKISKPGGEEEILPMEDGEIMYSPLNIMLSAGNSDVFKVFYNGIDDDIERYYKLIITELPIQSDLKKENDKDRQLYLFSQVSIASYLVVEPKDKNFSYNGNPPIFNRSF